MNFHILLLPLRKCPLRVSIWVCGLLSCQVAQSVPKHDPDEITVPAGTPVVLRLTGEISSNPRKHQAQPPQLLVANHVIVNGELIVTAGTAASFYLAQEPPKRLLRGGKVALTVEGVTSVAGIDIPLRGALSAQEDGMRCAMEGCMFAPLFLWMKGAQAILPADSLTTVYVSSDVVLRKLPAPARSMELSPPPQSVAATQGIVHLYAVPPEEANEWSSVHLSLDSKGLGWLQGARYGCVSIPPGKHMLRGDGGEPFELNVEAGKDYYIRIRIKDNGRGSVELTEGYQIGDTTYRSVHEIGLRLNKHFDVACWSK